MHQASALRVAASILAAACLLAATSHVGLAGTVSAANMDPPATPSATATTPPRIVKAPLPAQAAVPPTSFNKEFGINANLTWSGPDQAAADVDRAHVAGLASVRT